MHSKSMYAQKCLFAKENTEVRSQLWVTQTEDQQEELSEVRWVNAGRA